MRTLEIIALIYKSPSFLNLIRGELESDYCKVAGWDINYRIVANDASQVILDKLAQDRINSSVYHDPKPNDYYLNRVYRCWNYAGATSPADHICLVNSDMVFSEGWLENLLNHHDGVNIPTSRLIESGKMDSGQHGISFNCGQTLKTFERSLFNRAASDVSEKKTEKSGLFMPCVFEKRRFMTSGGYPEGNIYQDGIGTLNGFVQSGDDWYFKKLEREYGMKHITVFNSLVYHFQEGEMDE